MNITLELYEYKPKQNVVPGFVIIECVEKGTSYFDLKRRLKLKTNLIKYFVSCKRQGDKIEITIETFWSKETHTIRLGNRVKVKEESMYLITDNRLFELAIWEPNEGYIKLYFNRDIDAPTLYINGVHMHSLTVGPFRDSLNKVLAAGIKRGDIVLDTCMGLGYTAIAASALGAKTYTVEVSEAVIALAQHNPASWPLSKIKIIHGDVYSVADLLPTNFFDKIIHDPPRFELAGELYSTKFYMKLYKLLKPGGILVHYTGLPRNTRGRGYGPIVRGVMYRLQKVGFSVRFNEKVKAVIGVKY